MLNVLVVDDSPVVREFLSHIISGDPEMRVSGAASNGEEAVRMVGISKPDVITMDIDMPKMNGLEATRAIMETTPVPIIIVSGSYDVTEVETAFRTMEAGAVAAVPRPSAFDRPDHEASKNTLLRTIRLMSEVKVVKRWPNHRPKQQTTSLQNGFSKDADQYLPQLSDIRLVAIGASTGGPPVLHSILSGLKKGFPVPVLIVQHIASGFLPGMIDWMSKNSGLEIHMGRHGDLPLPGHAYFAPDGTNMGIDHNERIFLGRDGNENGVCPSVSFLFRSVAEVYGRRALGVLLTGMGRDGAEELRLMKDRGAITVCQDRESSIVHGMPGEAIRLGAASHVLAPDKITALLSNIIINRG